jgi:alkaline phosphatase D
MRAKGKGWLQYKRDFNRFMEIVGERKSIFLSGDIHENALLPPSTGSNLYEVIASGAAVMKFASFGKRQNYGVLDWSPERTRVKLVDKRGVQSYVIDNESFSAEEDEPDSK